jgi:hypothetical protein
MLTVIHLVLITCLQGACSEHKDPEWVYETSMSCMVDAQREFSEMLRHDPRLHLKSFRCEMGQGERT